MPLKDTIIPEPDVQQPANTCHSTALGQTHHVNSETSLINPGEDAESINPAYLLRQASSSTGYSQTSEDDEEAMSGSDDDSVAHKSISDNQAQLRKEIVKIQGDATLDATAKAKKIQELMSQSWTQKQNAEHKCEHHINKLAEKKTEFGQVCETDKCQTFHSEKGLGCRHYLRACKLQAHCCGKWDTCRFCHDEVSDHTITRNLITTMMCMYCWQVQPAGQDCNNPECGKRVAAYYCKECKLWDNDTRKNIYHCHDCGICRIGKGLGIDYFHCTTCNVCMAIGLKGKHKCIERNLESDCPICGEYMFTSTSTVIFMPCGHCMHQKCQQQYIRTSYQCPTCLKSLTDMTEYFQRIDQALMQHQMPKEYEKSYSHVFCNDCEKKSYAKFHFLYHKCGHCLGYNTKVLKTQQGLPEDAIIAPALHSRPQLTETRTSSSNSIFSEESGYSASQGASSNSLAGNWCHNCQAEVTIVDDQGTSRCSACTSDFIEVL